MSSKHTVGLTVKIFAGVTLGPLAALIIYFVLTTTPQERAAMAAANAVDARCGDAIAAYVMAETFVKRRLKNPAGASFAGYAHSNVTRDAQCVWTVTSYVDATNSFNAAIREPFKVMLKKEDGDTWASKAVEFTQE